MLQHNVRNGRKAAVQVSAMPGEPATVQAQVHACQDHEGDSALHSCRGLLQGTAERRFAEALIPVKLKRFVARNGDKPSRSGIRSNTG